MGIDLTAMFNNNPISKNTEYDVEYIDINLIKESKKNFYNTDEFQELKMSIALSGLLQNIEVKEIHNKFKMNKFKMNNFKFTTSSEKLKFARDFLDTHNINLELLKFKRIATKRKILGVNSGDKNGHYEIVSGHRRFKACKELFEEGNSEFNKIPCRISRTTSLVESEMELIFGNAFNRELSDYEKMQQVVRLSEVLEVLKKEDNKKFSGKKRDIIAELLKMSKTQVGRYQSIDKNLIPELKEELKQENLNLTTASELARLDKTQQAQKLEQIKQGEKVTATTLSKEIEQTKSKEVKKTVEVDEIQLDGQLELDFQDEISEEKVPIMDTKTDAAENANSTTLSSDEPDKETIRGGISTENDIESFINVIENTENVIGSLTIKTVIKKYEGKLSVVSNNIEKYKAIGRKPNKNDLEEQLELQIIVEALSHYLLVGGVNGEDN